MMYSNYLTGDITLWYDGRDTKETRGKRKRETEGCTNRQEREDEVDEVYKTLKEKHGTNYDIPRLRLWSRMICANIHEDTDNPPNIPAFSTMPSKKPRKNTFADAIEGAAVAFANAVSHKDDSSGKKGHVCCGDSPGPAVSPGKTGITNEAFRATSLCSKIKSLMIMNIKSRKTTSYYHLESYLNSVTVYVTFINVCTYVIVCRCSVMFLLAIYASFVHPISTVLWCYGCESL